MIRDRKLVIICSALQASSLRKCHGITEKLCKLCKLLCKLSHYGIRGRCLSLIESYLKYRTQVVDYNDSLSNAKSILSRVPQGSTLGSLLFPIYINDIFYSPLSVCLIAYADDITMLVTGATVAELSIFSPKF